MGVARDQTVFLASLPFVGQVDAIEERVVVEFGVVDDTLVIDTLIVVGK